MYTNGIELVRDFFGKTGFGYGMVLVFKIVKVPVWYGFGTFVTKISFWYCANTEPKMVFWYLLVFWYFDMVILW
jgi:hypothetical protein